MHQKCQLAIWILKWKQVHIKKFKKKSYTKQFFYMNRLNKFGGLKPTVPLPQVVELSHYANLPVILHPPPPSPSVNHSPPPFFKLLGDLLPKNYEGRGNTRFATSLYTP